MRTDSIDDAAASPTKREVRKWNTLYAFVVAALAAQIVFFVWLTKHFS